MQAIIIVEKHFRLRVVNIWKSLPDSVVDADTTNTFKSRLGKHWLDQDVVHNFHSELTETAGYLFYCRSGGRTRAVPRCRRT